MLLVFAMKCCSKIIKCLALCSASLPDYCCLLPSPVCLPHLLICTCLISSPIDCLPTIICIMLVSIVFFFFVICYISLWLHFGLFVYIFSLSFLFLCHSMRLLQFVLSHSLWFFHAIYVFDLIPLPEIFDGVGMMMMKHVSVFVVLFLGIQNSLLLCLLANIFLLFSICDCLYLQLTRLWSQRNKLITDWEINWNEWLMAALAPAAPRSIAAKQWIRTQSNNEGHQINCWWTLRGSA